MKWAFVFFIISFFFIESVDVSSQIINIQGNISTSNVPVRNASITFVNETDTTKKYSALTDGLGNYRLNIITSVNTNDIEIPKTFELEQNYPNPFSSQTVIAYKLKEQADVSIKIYNILGQEVRQFKPYAQSNGTHQIIWDGKDNLGRRITPGVYFCQLQSGGEKQIKKMLYQDSVPGSGNITFSGSLSAPKTLLKTEVDYTSEFTVEIKNTAGTSPNILEKKLTNITLQNDTTMNFVVEEDTVNKDLYVYTNYTDYINIINTRTLEVKKHVSLNLPEGMVCDGIGLSTNRDYFIIDGQTLETGRPQYIIVFNIKNDSTEYIYKSGLDTVGAPRFGAALRGDEPGLFYFYSHLTGLYSIDFLEQKVKDTFIDSERFNQDRIFFPSKDKKLIGVSTWYNGGNLDYSDFSISKTEDGIDKPYIILNENDMDGIYLDDAVFSEDNKKLFITYRLSHLRSKYIACYINYYNLQTKEFYKSPITLPWSLIPYNLEYSPKRKEAYAIGASNTLYIIDMENETLKDSIILTGKIQSPSEIILRNDENILFVSCPINNLVIAVDLDKREVIKRVSLYDPYFLFIP